MKTPPKGTPRVQQAVRAFHEAAKAALGVTTQTKVAAAIGETVQLYSNCMNGSRGTLDRVVGWVDTLGEQGVYLEVVFRAGKVIVQPVSD